MRGERVGGGIGAVVFGGIFPCLLDAVYVDRVCAADTARHRQHLTEGDLGLARIVEREDVGRHVLRRENFLIESVGDETGLLLEHDADRYAGKRLAAGGQFRKRFAVAAAEVALVDQVAVAHNQQSAVLAGLLDVFEGLVEFRGVDAGFVADFGGIGKGAPAALGIGSRIVVFAVSGCGLGQRQQQDGSGIAGNGMVFERHELHHTENSSASQCAGTKA